DATVALPPFRQWFVGREAIGAFFAEPWKTCLGLRLIRTAANGYPASTSANGRALGGPFDPRPRAALLHGSTEETHQPHPSPSSGNTDGNRASQLRHAVQNMDGDPNFCATALVLVEAQPIADDLFISTDHGLHTASFGIARRLLPCDPAFCGNILQMLVALRGLGLSGLARHGRGARRHDNQRVRISIGYGAVEAVLIVGAV